MSDSNRDVPLQDRADEPILEGTVLHPQVSSASRRLSWLMDDLIRIPGTRIRVGFDALIGLIPGIGDSATAAVATVIFIDAIRNRIPLTVLTRMALNVGIDILLGLIPGVGDLLDIAHRANRKNVHLLSEALENRERTHRQSRLYLVGAGAILICVIFIMIAAVIASLWILIRLLTWTPGA